MKNIFRALSGGSAFRGALPVVLIGLLTVSVACEDDDGPTGLDDEVASVTFASTSQTLEIGSTAQLTFEIRDAAGNLIDPDDVTIDFSSNTETVATISLTGLVTPVAPGTSVVTIEVGTVSDTITITVTPEISSIDILADLFLVSSETTTLDVTVLDAAGDPVTDPGLEFTTSNQAVATVSDDGVVAAVAEGTATITAAGGGESDSVEVTVLAASEGGISLGGNSFTVMLGDAVTINDLATVRDAGGVIIPNAELDFFVATNSTVVSVDASGLLTALAVGDALVTVLSPDAPAGSSATFRLSVLATGSVDTVTLDPATATIAVAATVDLDVVAESDGDPVDDFLAVFTSSDLTVATVDPFTGVVTGVAAGTATITATNGALTATSVITVE